MPAILHKSVTDPDMIRPALGRLWNEARSIADVRRRFAPPPAIRRQSDGAPVMVIPGFLSVDRATVRLRRSLGLAGYRAYGCEQGINLGASEARLGKLADRVAEIAERTGRPVALIGWSLGGLYAREIAKRAPKTVSRVITLGSPFSGNPRANNAWRLYEFVNRHPVDRLPIECDLAIKPPVRTIALWSRGDGIIAPACARGLPGESDISIEVACGHIGFTFESEAIAAVLDALKR
jgi:pimeloyl-ACP methyl ester carboxylesterase